MPPGTGARVPGTYASINEVNPNDSTVLSSPTGHNLPNHYEVSLSDVLAPLDLTTLKLPYRVSKSGSDGGQTTGLLVELREGSAVVYSHSFASLPGSSGSGWLSVTDVVSPQAASQITSYADLRLRFTPSSTGGGQGRKAQVSWAEVDLGCPGDPSTASSFGYDRLSRLTSSAGASGSSSYGYDPAGNRTSRTVSGTTTTYTYDRANRLTTANVAGSRETCAYHGNGLRFSRQVGTGTPIRYASDSSRGLPVTIGDGTRKYVYGLGLAYDVAGSAVEVYYSDRLGSVRAIVSSPSSVLMSAAS